MFLLLTIIVSCQQKKESNQIQDKSTASIDSLIAKGNKEIKSGNYDEAIQTFRKATHIDGQNIDALYGLGVTQSIICNIREELCEEAISTLSKVIEQNSTYRNSLYNRGTSYLALKAFHKALEDFNKAIELNPEDGDYHYNRALTLLELGVNESACNDLKKSLELGIEEANQLIQELCK